MSDSPAAKRPRLAEGYGFGLAGRMSAGALQQARHLASHTPHMACPGFDVGLASLMSARSLQQEQHDARHTDGYAYPAHWGLPEATDASEEWLSKGSAMIGRRVARPFNLLVALGTVVAWLPDNEEGDPALYRVVHDGDGDVEDLEGYEVEEGHARFQEHTEAEKKKLEAEEKKRVAAQRKKDDIKRLEELLTKGISFSKFLADRIQKDLSIRGPVMPQPKLITGGKMRPHQLAGVHWLVGLYENGLNGILGDEMGLGKRVQSIALLAHLKEHNVAGPFMVVGPASTLDSWKNEVAKWAPSMDAIVYRPQEEDRAETLRPLLPDRRQAGKILITSYDMVIRDTKYLKRCAWKFGIIDEGPPTLIINEDHRLKNMNCRLVKALKAICDGKPAQPCTRLLLTGTPLQNDPIELWSLLNHFNPSFFDKDHFRVLRAIKGEMEQGVVTKLHQVLRPFLLRRLKADVEQEEAELRAAEARAAAAARAGAARAAEARAAAERACERIAKIKRAHAPLNALQSRPPQPLVARSSTPALDPTSLSWSTPQPVDSLRREMQAIRCLRKAACAAVPSKGVRPPHCLLLSVTAGAGAMYVAAVAGRDCVISVDAARLASAPLEEALGELIGVFEKARSASPAIVFIDSFEHLSSTDEGKTACREAGFARPRLASQLCTLVDGLIDSSPSVLVIGATSALESVDSALRRSGRFDRVFMGREGALPDWVVRPASRRLLDEFHVGARLADELAREKRRQSEMAARLDGMKARLDGMAEAQLCSICLSEPKTHAVLPCLHKCMCAECAARVCAVPNAKCPICKGASSGVGRVWE